MVGERMKTYNLESIADVQVGYQSRSRIDEDVQGTHYLIQGKDLVKNQVLDLKGCLRFTPERKPEIYAVRTDDILFMARGAEHFAYLISQPLENVLASSSLYIIRVKTDCILSSYLVWLLNQISAQAYIQSQSGGGAISFITKSALLQTRIQVPPIEAQSKIVNVVHLWEKERKLQQKLMDRKEQLINWLCFNATMK